MVGDQKGNVGFDMERHKWFQTPYVGTEQARDMQAVSLTETIPHPVLANFMVVRSYFVRLGKELVLSLGRSSCSLEAAGIKNVLSKSLGSNNPLSVVGATMKGLLELRSAEQISNPWRNSHWAIIYRPNTRTFATGA